MIDKLVELFIEILFSSVSLDWFWYLASAFIAITIVLFIIKSFVGNWRKGRGYDD